MALDPTLTYYGWTGSRDAHDMGAYSNRQGITLQGFSAPMVIAEVRASVTASVTDAPHLRIQTRNLGSLGGTLYTSGSYDSSSQEYVWPTQFLVSSFPSTYDFVLSDTTSADWWLQNGSVNGAPAPTNPGVAVWGTHFFINVSDGYPTTSENYYNLLRIGVKTETPSTPSQLCMII